MNGIIYNFVVYAGGGFVIGWLASHLIHKLNRKG